MNILNLEAFKDTPLQHDPYDYVIVPGFITPEFMPKLVSDFPEVKKAGSFPIKELTYGDSFAALLSKLRDGELTKLVEEKFSVDLSGRPIMVTVRGNCRKTDGKIHTDTDSKIISMLIYMNSEWDSPGGRLRVLRSNNLEDMAAEIPPVAGTMIMFRRSENSWHGHHSFEGKRQVIQINWVTEQKYIDRETSRHGISSLFKRLVSPSY